MTASLKIRWCHAIQEVDPVQWQALVTPEISPFLHWDWLYALEKSGSASRSTGWLPCHLVIEQEGSLIAALPLYAKGHSNGEFVFDQEWARVAHQLGESYYPKLVGMAPFTPATGYRPLIHPDVDPGSLWAVMVEAIDRFCRLQDLSVCSLLYVDPVWSDMMANSGFTPRITHNYQWRNHNYQTFDDFLAQFNANQRRNIKRERAAMEKSGIQIKIYEGSQIPADFLKIMYRLYSNTCEQFYNWSKYLNKDFFLLLDPNFREHLVFVVGEDTERHSPVGMSFCIRKGDKLFGRYWGCFDEVKFLHFNACYYEPIDWAIQQKIQIFDPGAGGQHKIRRGFPATPLYSYHRFYRPQLKRILIPHLSQVNPLMLAELDHINREDVPFREDVLPHLINAGLDADLPMG